MSTWNNQSLFKSKVDVSDLPNEKFSGKNFKRWQQRMKIWLGLKGMSEMLVEVCPEIDPEDPTESAEEIKLWQDKDNTVRGAILLALSEKLFDVYCSESYTAKSLWDSLDKKYNTDDVGVEKYSVGKFLKFRMAEGKPVSEQVHEFQIIVQSLKDSAMELPEKFVVMSIIEKFPRSWEEFGMTLKHRKGSLSLNELMNAITIQEVHPSNGISIPVEATANLMTATGKFKGKNSLKSGTKENLNIKP